MKGFLSISGERRVTETGGRTEFHTRPGSSLEECCLLFLPFEPVARALRSTVPEGVDTISKGIQTLYRDDISLPEAVSFEELAKPTTFTEEIPRVLVTAVPRDICFYGVRETIHDQCQSAPGSLLGARLAIALLREEIMVSCDV
jgi:hypothetical protein